MTLREKIQEEISDLIDEFDTMLNFGGNKIDDVYKFYNKHINNILTLIKDSLPKVPKAHTYASENADDYIMWEEGYERAIQDMKEVLE